MRRVAALIHRMAGGAVIEVVRRRLLKAWTHRGAHDSSWLFLLDEGVAAGSANVGAEKAKAVSD